MKKVISIVLVALFIVGFSANAFIEYNEAGWVASNGKLTAEGQAKNLTVEPDCSYSFTCVGKGECFRIDGPWLVINEGDEQGFGESINVERL